MNYFTAHMNSAYVTFSLPSHEAESTPQFPHLYKGASVYIF